MKRFSPSDIRGQKEGVAQGRDWREVTLEDRLSSNVSSPNLFIELLILLSSNVTSPNLFLEATPPFCPLMSLRGQSLP